jgi:hypothetical protein
VPSLQHVQIRFDRLNKPISTKSRNDRLQLKNLEVEANRVTTTQQFDSDRRKPRYSKEEFARRGEEIYQSQIRLPPVGYANAS